MRKIFKFKELIAVILTISTSLFFLPQKYFSCVDITNLSNYSAILNIVVLILGILAFSTLSDDFYLIKRKHGEYDNSNSGLKDLESIGNILKITPNKTKYLVERTSAVVGQLIKNFTLFLWPLIIFYALNIVKDYLNLKPLIHPDFFKANSFREFMVAHPGADSYTIFLYLSLGALANIFNFISAIGLWVCFSTLYQKTVDADNKSTLNMGVYYFLLTFYILAYIILLGTDIVKIEMFIKIFMLDLFCAIFNCVAMILFFNRLVQILFFYQNSLRQKLLDKFYFFIATILFPLYACFQIFFAVFDQIVSDAHPYYQVIKGSVFFVCFLGKLFLTLFLFSFIRIKWLHAAILTLMAYEEVPIELARNVSAISNSIDAISDDIKDLKDG